MQSIVIDLEKSGKAKEEKKKSKAKEKKKYYMKEGQKKKNWGNYTGVCLSIYIFFEAREHDVS